MISLEEGLTTSLSSSGSVLAAGSRPTIGQKVYRPFYEQAKQLYLEKPDFFPNPDAPGTAIVSGPELQAARACPGTSLERTREE
jgi:hypothetical protein